MRLQARQRDARKVERVDPRVLEQGIPARVARREGAVEFGVMRDHLCVAHERGELGKRIRRGRSVGYIAIVNVGEVRHIFRNRLAGVHERDEPLDNLTVLHSSGCDLRQLVVMERETRGFRVQHHDIVVEIAKIRRSGDFGKRRIAIADGLRRTIAYETLQGILRGHVLFIHTG